MTIVEKYEYRSNNDVKLVRKEDLKTLTEAERKSIKPANPVMYAELMQAVQKCTNEWEATYLTTNLESKVSIGVSPHFNKNMFMQTIGNKWDGHWSFIAIKS